VTVSVTAGVTTLEDVRAALDADPALVATISGGKLSVTAAGGTTFAFDGDSSDTLLSLGLNTFFTGSDARSIAVSPMVQADVASIAAARADAAGLVHVGDGSNALALADVRTTLALAGGTQTFADAFGALVGRVGSQSRQAQDAVERQGAAVEAVEALQQQTSGVSTDEELVALTQSQTAYEAAARHITTMREVIQSLLDAVR
jgi:flagellar hook-associated protein 1 FlgK